MMNIVQAHKLHCIQNNWYTFRLLEQRYITATTLLIAFSLLSNRHSINLSSELRLTEFWLRRWKWRR